MSVANMTPYMVGPFFWLGYPPPHGRTGRKYFSIFRASGGMRCQSQFFSIPFQCTARFENSMAIANTSVVRAIHESVRGPREDVQCKLNRRWPCEGKFHGSAPCRQIVLIYIHMRTIPMLYTLCALFLAIDPLWPCRSISRLL